MPNLAIFGGTFNPVHWGHLLIAETALDQFQLDRVIWVPTVRPPHKAQALLAFEHRLAMVRLAIADHPAFVASDVEGQQHGMSYAIATLNALQALEPDACWHWLVGNDAFQSLPKWQASQELAARCIWLVAPRVMVQERGEESAVSRQPSAVSRRNAASQVRPPPFWDASSPVSPLAPLTSTPPPPVLSLRWHLLEMPFIAISSSLIRQRCLEGRSIRYLVPETVRRYIVNQKLYQMS